MIKYLADLQLCPYVGSGTLRFDFGCAEKFDVHPDHIQEFCRSRQLTSALWLPMCIAAAYLLVLRTWGLQMQASNLQGSDPFKQTSWIPAAVASVLYLLFVHFGRKFMASRKPYELKDCMFTYNVYQACDRSQATSS